MFMLLWRIQHVTDNGKRKRIHFEKAPTNLIAVIFIPKNRKRGNLKKSKNTFINISIMHGN